MQEPKYPMVASEYDRFWVKYCGFLDLSLGEFMSIQQSLLLQQMQEMANTPLVRRLLGDNTPATMDEFRASVPLTTYQDYLPYFERGNGDFLPESPYIWTQTSDSSNPGKVPYTYQFYNIVLDSLMSVFILACSKKRGQTSIVENDRVLFNVAPSPYMSGVLAHGASERFKIKPVILPDSRDGLDFTEKLTRGFEAALQNGVDILIAMTGALVEMGNEFNNGSQKGKVSGHLLHPGVLYRYAKAYMQSKMEKRGILPRDLWPVKAIIGWGTDTDAYREHVYKYWGKYPYIFHACAEAGIIAMQSWTRKGLTFVPYSNFFEFIPEDEWLENRRDSSYQPRTVLISELEPGGRYELVITSSHRMPFMRYRLGHLIKITALEDREAGIQLPQMVCEPEAGNPVDGGVFTGLGEEAAVQPVAQNGLNRKGGPIRKEIEPDNVIHILRSERIREVLVASNMPQRFKNALARELVSLNPDNLQRGARRGAVCCVVDFSEDMHHEVTTDLTFEDLKKRRYEPDEPLNTLNLANAILEKGGQLKVICTGPYSEPVVEKYLLCTKFTDIQFGPKIISATKRDLVKYPFNDGQMMFEETTSPDLIRSVHIFASKLFQDYEFDIEIDDIFTPYSDFFVCYKTGTKEIVSFLRYTWHLPRHFLPCMLATKSDDGQHIDLDNPDEYAYAEIFSPYINSLSTLKAYKELMRNIVRHVLLVGTTNAFTTVSRSEPKSGDFYKRVFGFEDTGITLKYGNFEGEWGLLKGGKNSIFQAQSFFSKTKSAPRYVPISPNP